MLSNTSSVLEWSGKIWASLLLYASVDMAFSLCTFVCALGFLSDFFSSFSIFSVCSCASCDARAFLASISCSRVISSSSLRRKLSLESLVVVSSENFTNCMGRKEGTLLSAEMQCFTWPLLGESYQCQLNDRVVNWCQPGTFLSFRAPSRSIPNGGLTRSILNLIRRKWLCQSCQLYPLQLLTLRQCRFSQAVCMVRKEDLAT